MNNIILPVGLGVMVLVVILILLRPKKVRLDQRAFGHAAEKIHMTKDLDTAYAVLNSHSVFINTVQSLYPQKKLNATQAIQIVEKRLPNAAKIWAFHRMRNRIAHDNQGLVPKLKAVEAQREFIRALEALK